MSIKKILSLILCAAMLFTFVIGLAACNSEEPTTETEATEDSATEAPTNAPTASATKKKTNKKTTNEGNLDDYDLNSYDLAKYLSPVWAGEISYAESAFVREGEDGIIAPISLLYPIDEVISVRSADLLTTYINGQDYYIDDNGDIVILPDGNIPVLAYDDYIFDASEERATSAAGGKPISVYGQPDKKFVYGEISAANGGMSHWVIAVTYKHSAQSILTVPTDKSAEFSNLITKLEAGQEVNIVSIGDSITEGWSSSKVKGKKAPYCPPYNEMVADYIQSVYEGATVNFTNLGVSGTTTTQGSSSEILDKVCENNPDLLMIAYGMNDGCSMVPSTYTSNIEYIIKYVSEKYPNVCIVVVGTSLPNPEFAWDGGGRCLVYHDQYPEALAEKEVSWSQNYNVAVADVTTTNIEMYARKVYQDVTGSNSNHPNDYMHRIYAQVILQTIFGNLAPLS